MFFLFINWNTCFRAA